MTLLFFKHTGSGGDIAIEFSVCLSIYYLTIIIIVLAATGSATN